GREVEVERLQQVPERGRVPRGGLVDEREHAQGGLGQGVVAGQRGQAQQPEGGGRAAGRNRRVLEVLAPGEQAMVGRRGPEAAVLTVGEAVDQRRGEVARGRKPALLERGLVQREQ